MQKFGELNSKEKKHLTKVYNKLLPLQTKSCDGYFEINKLKASVLASLLLEAIDKIDYLQNVASCDDDERDWKDQSYNEICELIDLLNQQDKRIKELEKENGFIVFADGYDENGNEVHKQKFVKYKDIV